MRRYIRETRAAGAIPIVCSPIARNDWKNGKVVRSPQSYAGWAKAVAEAEGVSFIDLNDIIATRYEAMGPEAVKPFFPVDHTHTDKAGAQLNAEIVMAEVRKLGLKTVKRSLR